MRVFFPKRAQREFINRVIFHISIKEIAKLCNLSERTIRDWRREKFLMNLNTLRKICKNTGIKFPSNIKLRDDYWYVTKGSSAGGIAMWKKYGRIGDPEYRRKKWYEWWEKKGKYRKPPNTASRPIKEPCFSKELAEFAGILLGDGGVSHYQVRITLNSKEEKSYGKFVADLLRRLFKVPVRVRRKKEDAAIDYIVSRRRLVLFCRKKLGLKEGSKIRQRVDMPNWVKRNKGYAVACTRGLFDTDGCVFTHRYISKGKKYSYKKLIFTNYSQNLRRSVFNVLKINGLNPRMAQRSDVRIDSIKDVQQYFKIFGSHNPYLLKRFLE